MKSLLWTALCFTMVLFSCKSSKSTYTEAEIDKLVSLIEKKQFQIESNWAYPQTTNALQQVLNSGILQPGNNAGSINLTGNSNFLRVSGDSITSYLPYFGERQMQVNYGGGDSAIQFNGILENYQYKKRKDNGYDITFNAKSNNESFNVYITLWPSLKSNMSFNSASRFPIRYSGDAEVIEE